MPATADAILAGLSAGRPAAYDEFETLVLNERAEVINRLLNDPRGRHWLRSWPGLDATLVGRLLDHEGDFRLTRRDASLSAVVARAAGDDLLLHVTALAGGQAAAAFWSRLANDREQLRATAVELAAGSDETAAAATLDLVVLDPLDPWVLGDVRGAIAQAGLESPFPIVRGLAAEYLAGENPAALLRVLETLVGDPDERLRAIAWRVGYRHDRSRTRELALELLGDERIELAARRSALLAAGEYLPTDDIVELLSWFVASPDPALAGDAANLLYTLHRHPIIAEAALHSPHAHVRDTAERLLDPLRGSPAAGGNRPGSPVDTSALFEDLIRRETRGSGPR